MFLKVDDVGVERSTVQWETVPGDHIAHRFN